MSNISPNSINNNGNTEEEIRLADIIQFLKDSKFWIVATTVLCIIIGVIYAFLAPEKYEATVSIEMASVANVAVETPSILSEKMKLPLYYSPSTYKACQTENMLPSPGYALAKQLTPTANKVAPIVSFEFRAKSPATAKQCLEAVVSDIKGNQSALLKPTLEIKKSQLLSLQQKLEGTEKLKALLPAKQMEFKINNPEFLASTLITATRVAREGEIRDLRNLINDMQISLTAPQTRETTLVTPIYAPSVPVAPKKALIIFSSGLIGIFLGTLLSMGRKIFF